LEVIGREVKLLASTRNLVQNNTENGNSLRTNTSDSSRSGNSEGNTKGGWNEEWKRKRTQHSQAGHRL